MLIRKNQPSSLSDEALMALALEQARNGGWECRPNPRVGAALLSRDGTLVAAFHRKAGENHAEREVLRLCAENGVSPKGARMAVTLEPCSHSGRTPPCVEALIEAKIAKVAVGLRDPAPWVNGKGLQALRAGRVELVEGVLQAECEALNHGWLESHRMGRSFVRLKMATSIDGKWTADDGGARWITGPRARAQGRELRALADLIVTGRGTVEADDPAFTVRDEDDRLGHYQPPVVVLSRGDNLELDKYRLAKHPGGARVESPSNLLGYLRGLLQERHVHEVHLEAGPRLSQAFLEEGLVDELHWFMAPRLLGGKGAAFQEPFAQGALPGLELKLQDQSKTEDGDLYFVLQPLKRVF